MIATTEPYRRVLAHVLPLVEAVLERMDASVDDGRSAVQLWEARQWICAALSPRAIDVDVKGIYVELAGGGRKCEPWQ